MQEDKKRTTPPGESSGARRRRNRKKAAARPAQKGEKVGAAAEVTPASAAQTEETAPSTAAQQAVLDTETAVPTQEVPQKEEVTAPQHDTAQAESEPVPETVPAGAEETATTAEKAAETAEEEPVLTAEQPADTEAAAQHETVAAEENTEEEKVLEEESPAEEPETANAPSDSEMPAAEQPEDNEPQGQDTEEKTEATTEETLEKETAEADAAEKSEPEEPSSEKSAETVPAEEAETVQEEATEQQDDQSEESDADETEADEEELLPEEDEKRLSDLTRTVQLSVEQIMAQVSDETAAPENVEDSETEEADETDEETDGLVDQMRNGLSGMAKWLLLVVFFVLVIACCGVAWLYRNATPDMLPQITASFDGQTLEPTAYKWKVPVIGNVFKRTYADTFSSTALPLPETVDQVSPDFEISPSGYRCEVTVTDANDAVVFEGNTDSFSEFQFTANGTYTAKLVVHSDASSVPGDATVTGSETWLFSFTVGVRPSMRLSSTSVSQGSVIAISVGDTLDGSAPTLETQLENAGFYKANTGWVCYLPIPWNEPTGTQKVTVTAGGCTETLEFTVEAAEWEYKDYYSQSQRVSPYIGANDLPTAVEKLLTESEADIAWTGSNFVQPFLNTLDVKLGYGTTEYVGRSYSERDSNTGAGGRTATNTVLTTKSGELLIAPANGTVLLAKDLGGDYGYTLVIDHGAGVKSIFYNLQKIDVKVGESLKQGQTIATCGSTTVAEMRIGTVPIDPLQVWRGQCNALKYY
ncbi:peptidoglycan DD-metalloendopeptidase family protein [uncultured Subdoligranulum sp.]|uniref:murein hydrolase activator EnvC family protein n=1 Tax=uncultured Subdoligranulum sp. TaxID=512298 RepID=UPI0026029322|nr:peptidoglycan DD-metalloendopeptidase family protein [uncultured Subdoligranulum sp.]